MRWRWVAGGLAACAVAAVLVVVLAGTGSPARHPSPPRAARPPAPAPPAQPTPAPAPAPAPVGEQFGANVGGLFERPAPLPETVIAADLAALRATGATIAREDALWDASEPAPPVNGVHRYDWSFDDAIAGALAAQGLRWLATLDYAPGWADASAPQGAVHPPPRDDADYAAYCAAFVARYGPGGTFWAAHPKLPAAPVDTVEIWNEPDNPTFWYPAPSVREYAALYAAARAAIAAAAPTVHVILAGLNHPQSTLPALLPALRALHAPVDGVAIHPYADGPAGVLAHVGRARAQLRRLGLGAVPLYVTEYGWTTQPPGSLDYAPASARPGYIETTLAALGHTDCNIAAVTVFSWVTLETNPRSYADWFGLEPVRGGPSPDRSAFAAGVRAAQAPGPTRALCGPGH